MQVCHTWVVSVSQLLRSSGGMKRHLRACVRDGRVCAREG